MSVVTTTASRSELAAVLRPFAVVFAAWGGLTRKHFLYTLLFGLAWAAADVIVFWQDTLAGATRPLSQIAYVVISRLLAGIALMLAVVVADRVTPGRLPRWLPYLIAVAAGAAAALLFAHYFSSHVMEWEVHFEAASARHWSGVRLALSHMILVTGLATFLYVRRRDAVRRLAVLRATQLERAKRSRQVLESRLQVMQARVEPQFLFNTLAQVERLYDTDTKLADVMLNDLIVYLRAALPLLRETTSTLGKEIDLARAYLNIMKVRLQDRLSFDISVPEPLKDARLPPMMLLPLIDHAIVYGLEPAKAGGSIVIGTAIEGDRLRLHIGDSGAGFVSEPATNAMQEIRERLTALYGDAASLTLTRSSPQGTTATMEIPYERTQSPDR